MTYKPIVTDHTSSDIYCFSAEMCAIKSNYHLYFKITLQQNATNRERKVDMWLYKGIYLNVFIVNVKVTNLLTNILASMLSPCSMLFALH